MKDIRLLTLYKQHYLDDYDESMKSHISCLGYYDGLDIKKVEECEFIGNKKYQKRLATITEIWYSTGKNIEQLSGGHSNQNIGLFRYDRSEIDQEYTTSYWDTEKNLPYFSVAFLKLEESKKYYEAGMRIDQFFHLKDKDLGKKTCIALTYDTIDNSDLVVLLKSNSMAELGHVLDTLETNPYQGIIYMHSILGIEEEYLKECMENNEILNTWRGSCCFIDDEVARIELHLAACGGSSALNVLKSILDEADKKWGIQGYQNMRYSYVGGHGNINIKLSQTDIRSLLVFLLPGGFSTHQNPSYNYKNGIYNIETEIFVEERSWNKLDASNRMSEEKITGAAGGWCKQMIKKYRDLCSEALKMEDDSLYACYQALIQTLNALDQYERFSMSRDIFDTIYPSFAIFDRKINAAIQEIKTDENIDKLQQLKEMMREYLECVNSVVYHTVHTEQVFLMIPGYSGTSFAIPIKLHLFYLWFVYTVIQLLNDCGKLHACIVVPVMESRPQTRFIGMEFHNDEKLIHIRLSQRSLFRAGELMIILAHEMSHYIGRWIRCRSRRLECILKTMAYCIAEAICPQEDLGVPLQVSTQPFQMMKKRLKSTLQMQLGEWFQKKKGALRGGFYGDEIFVVLMKWAVNVFKEEGDDAVVYRQIRKVTDETVTEIIDHADYDVQNIKQVYRIQQYFDRNRKMWLNSGAMQQIVKELLQLYKEVFADMSSIAILKCSREEFHNAFIVSDGSSQGRKKQKFQQIRERIANEVVFYEIIDNANGIEQAQEKKSIWTTEDHKLSQVDIIKSRLVRYTWVNDHLKTYAEECYKTVNDRVGENPEMLKEIREVYELFKDPESDYDHIFACMNTCIAKYKDMVNEQVCVEEVQ